MIGYVLFASSNHRLRSHIRYMQVFRDRGFGRLALLMELRIQKRFGVFVSRYAQISTSVSFPHPTGIVIGEGVVIDDDVTIYQNVTLGGARMGDWQKGNYPEIGRGAILFAGVVAVGKLCIGQHCVVGANSVVLQDLPDNSVAVGAPARVLKANNIALRTNVSEGVISD